MSIQEEVSVHSELPPIRSGLPLSYRWLRANGVSRLVPWHFCDDPKHIAGLRAQYWLEMDGSSDVLPFAQRQDMDDIAGFIVVDGTIQDRVLTVHLSWARQRDMPWLKPGEQPPPVDLARFPSFQDWFSRVMLAESIEWQNEEDLAAILSGDWPNFGKEKPPRP